MKGLLVYVDRMHKTKWHKLALCLVIDSLSASMHFLPSWAYWLLGEAGAPSHDSHLYRCPVKYVLGPRAALVPGRLRGGTTCLMPILSNIKVIPGPFLTSG